MGILKLLQPELLFTQDEMLVALVTILVAILSLGMAHKILCLC